MSLIPRPAFDAELHALLTGMPLVERMDEEILAQLRALPSPSADSLLAGRRVVRREVDVPAEDGAVVRLSVLSPADRDPAVPAPCVYWIHGGGMVMGDRFGQIDVPLDWLERFGAVVVTVEYRLAPEATGTTAVEDCHRGLAWVAAHGEELGVDPGRVVVAGISSGGGLAAGLCLLARDLGTPAITAQLLICPMLDHRNVTASSRQYSGEPGVWTRETNEFAWRTLLGGPADGEVPPYVSPARAVDLSGLPTAYVDTGSAEVFRDEDVAYASGIWAAGGQAELHVWAGGHHGFDAQFPQAELSVTARRTRADWLGRVLRRAAAEGAAAGCGSAAGGGLAAVSG
ncbi:alpha/beta hydrolase [Streptomyces albogriseolus]|uniref:alpha/beta hydrolase n=1 Tax=Streptomyces albogriseolus TaxID=1887 RepID=UPI0033A60559